MIPFLLSLLKSKYFWIIAVSIALVSALWIAIASYGESQYKAGRAAADLEWSQKFSQAQARASRAEEDLARTRIERDQARAERDESRRRALVQVTQEIENAPNFEARYAAYLAHRDRLRNARSERLARARADYLSSIAPD